MNDIYEMLNDVDMNIEEYDNQLNHISSNEYIPKEDIPKKMIHITDLFYYT